jgi:hypothetical protein
VTGATINGVRVLTNGRRRGGETFDLALTADGIEILRPGELARHLPWERISEWEIEQRRGCVQLVLRGDGAVTPLVVPRWRIDDLDAALRAASASVPGPEPSDGDPVA